MKIIIVGNGILGLTTAYQLVKKDPQCEVVVVGPEDHAGCASLAAAAMLNSFCEVDPHTLSNEVENKKFMLNRAAAVLWPEFLETLQADAALRIVHGFGTYLINNLVTDRLEDSAFDAVVNALEKLNEPFEKISVNQIPNYAPAPYARAARAIFIHREGWVNPVHLINSLKAFLQKNKNVTWVNEKCHHLNSQANKITEVILSSGDKLTGDKYLLCPGATFSEVLKNSQLAIKTPRIFYGIGCSILLKTAEYTHTHCVRTPNRGLACGIYSAPFDAQHTIVGASNFISPVSEDAARLTSVHTLVESAMEQINTVFYRAQLVKVNVGWRPTSADTVPLIGKTSFDNLVVATGTKRDGLHCSPLLSKNLASLLYSEESSYDFTFFKPERDLYRVYSRQEAVDMAVQHTMNAAYQHGFKSAKNRMVEDIEKHYRNDIEELHDKAGAFQWGIPPEMLNMYRYGHIESV